jgi:hypothetical protein
MSHRSIGRLYHLAEASNLPLIENGGLLSTSKLLDQAGLFGEERHRLEHQQRLSRTVLSTGVIIRDQLPMPPSALTRCLGDRMLPSGWYALVNTMVFLWVDRERLIRQARACYPWPQVIIEIDAERFLARYEPSAFVTPINVGNARRRPALRGRASFVPFVDWRDRAWTHEAQGLGVRGRPASHPPAELVVPGAIPDVMDYVVSVQKLTKG